MTAKPGASLPGGPIPRSPFTERRRPLRKTDLSEPQLSSFGLHLTSMCTCQVCRTVIPERRVACPDGFAKDRPPLFSSSRFAPCLRRHGADDRRHLTRAGSASGPLPDLVVLLADASLVQEPDLDGRRVRHPIEIGAQRAREVFFERLETRAPCPRWRGLSLVQEKPSFLRSLRTWRS